MLKFVQHDNFLAIYILHKGNAASKLVVSQNPRSGCAVHAEKKRL